MNYLNLDYTTSFIVAFFKFTVTRISGKILAALAVEYKPILSLPNLDHLTLPPQNP